MPRKLRVFLCHASEDKPAVRELYQHLASESWIEPWLDEEDLLPGQDFDLEIYKATRDADAIIICLSKTSVAKEGYVNKEIRRAYDIALEKPEGAIYVIPLRLDECNPSFEYLKKLHWVDYFKPNSNEKLVKALRARAGELEIEIIEDAPTAFSGMAPSNRRVKKEKPITRIAFPWPSDTSNVDLDLYHFIQILATEEVPYSFYIGKYPVTNAQYERFLNAKDYSEASIWRGFPKYNEDCIQIGYWHDDGWAWFQEQMKDPGKFLDNKRIKPGYWNEENFGILNPDNPVVGVSWYEANAYCNWLMKHWKELDENRANSGVPIKQTRLPLDFEWTVAAGGEEPDNRYPWDAIGNVTTDEKEISRRANVANKVGHTTPVTAYFRGSSPHNVMDMAGNVWEWQANFRYTREGLLDLRGGSWNNGGDDAHVFVHTYYPPYDRFNNFGFRVVVLPRE